MVYEHDVLYNCYDLYEQGVGVKWDNLIYARTGEGYGAYAHIKGSKSATEYKPKDLCYIYKYDKIDPSKYKVGNVYFTIIFRKYNLNKNDFPKIRIYRGKKGDNTFIREISAYTKLENKLEYDKHTLQFLLGDLTVNDLKSLIVKVVWDKTKSTELSEISINRARLSINYLPLTPKFTLFQSSTSTSITTNDEFEWKLTVKNTGDCGTGRVTLNLPTGATITKSISGTNGGTFNYNTNQWTFSLCKNQTATRSFKIKFNFVNRYTLRATNDINAVNKSVETQVNVRQYYPSPNSEKIIYTFYPTFAWEDGYFDVTIYGVYNGQQFHCYDITIPQGITVDYPLRDNVLTVSTSNVAKMIHTGDAEYTITQDNRICLKVSNTLSNFTTTIRIPFHSLDENTLEINTHSNDSNNDYKGTLDILAPRGMILVPQSAMSRNKRYVYNSVNIGSPHIWTVRCKASSKNFFDERKDHMEIDIEQRIAFIGVIPLERCHKADVTATSKNTLIENRYLNRAYYGKKGDYSEDIKMTLRMAWQDVATLQGLCAMDKPIPVDTIPNRADGDPLNHRGWVEIHEVSNIHKINDLYYECDVGVTYLTHNIITSFSILEKAKISTKAISHYLALVHDWGDSIFDVFRPSYYQNFAELEDEQGNCIGAYELDAPSSLKLSNVEDINKYSTWDITFRNELPVLMSEDFDGNWEMAFRVKNDNGTTLFQHLYNNYQHYDSDNNLPINTCDVTTTSLNGNKVETLNLDKITLGYDSLAPLVEDRKEPTHIISMESSAMSSLDSLFEGFLLDSNNKGVANKVIMVTIESNDGFTNKFNVVTDLKGRFFFNPRWGNGDYDVVLTFEGDEKYRSSKYTTEISVELDYVEYHFDYSSNEFVSYGGYYYFTLLDENEDGVEGQMVHYSFKNGNGDYGYERTVVTDENGDARIPIDCTIGNNKLRVNFKGYSWNGVVYQPVQFENSFYVSSGNLEQLPPMQIEADNVEIVMGDVDRTYNVTIRDITYGDGTVANGVNVKIAIYDNDNTFLYNVTTNQYGVASVPLLLSKGVYNVDIHLGDISRTDIIPVIATKTITVRDFEQMNTYIISNTNVINESSVLGGTGEYYTITLYNSEDIALPNEIVHIEVFDDEDNTWCNVTLRTDADGKIEVPFLAHGEYLNIKSTYDGGAKYKPSELVELVQFEEVTGKQEVTIYLDNISNEFKITQSGVTSKITNDEFIIGDIEIYLNYADKPYKINKGKNFLKYLETGDYTVTIAYKGTGNYYSQTKTFEYTNTTDTRTSLYNFSIAQGGRDGNQIYHEFEVDDTPTGGKTYGYRRAYVDFGFDIGDCDAYFVVGTYDSDLDSLDYVETVFVNYDRFRGSYFECDYLCLHNLTFVVESEHFTRKIFTQTIAQHIATSTDLYVSGFGTNGKAYNHINFRVGADNVPINTQINQFYVLRLINMATHEELKFANYLVDSSTEVWLDVLLSGNESNPQTWRMNLITIPTETYQGNFYRQDATIDDDSIEEYSDPTSITNYDAYNIIGSGEITINGDEIFFSGGYYESQDEILGGK